MKVLLLAAPPSTSSTTAKVDSLDIITSRPVVVVIVIPFYRNMWPPPPPFDPQVMVHDIKTTLPSHTWVGGQVIVKLSGRESARRGQNLFCKSSMMMVMRRAKKIESRLIKLVPTIYSYTGDHLNLLHYTRPNCTRGYVRWIRRRRRDATVG